MKRIIRSCDYCGMDDTGGGREIHTCPVCSKECCDGCTVFLEIKMKMLLSGRELDEKTEFVLPCKKCYAQPERKIKEKVRKFWLDTIKSATGIVEQCNKKEK